MLSGHNLLAQSGNTTPLSLVANNTSATTQPGDPNSQNVSKISLQTELATAVHAKIYSRLMVWFGSSSHADVGYVSTDAAQVEKQLNDMVARGLSGVIVNWQGTTDFTDEAARAVMSQVNAQAGFGFAIEEDAHALAQCAATAGCDLNGRVISDLNFIQATYGGATSYLRRDGQPVIFLYGMEAYHLNWPMIQSSLTGRPVLVFRNSAA
jgi:hypothetical protein